MTYRIKLKRVAANDIDDIAAYIQQDNPIRAQTFTEEINAKIGTVAERPLSFPAREDLTPGLRSATIGSYLILFRIDDPYVEIIRVLHGARDIESMFS